MSANKILREPARLSITQQHLICIKYLGNALYSVAVVTTAGAMFGIIVYLVSAVEVDVAFWCHNMFYS